MAVTFRSATSLNDTDYGTSISVPPPAGLASGDLWIIMVQLDGESSPATYTINTPSGWSAVSDTFTPSPTYLHPSCRAFYKEAGSSESNVTITVTTSYTVFDIFAVSVAVYGQHNTTPLGDVGTETSDNTTYAAPSVDVTEDGSLAILWAAETSSGNIDEPSGTTLIAEKTGAWCSSCHAYDAVDSGTYSAGNWTNFSNYGCVQTFVIRPAGEEPPTGENIPYILVSGNWVSIADIYVLDEGDWVADEKVEVVDEGEWI